MQYLPMCSAHACYAVQYFVLSSEMSSIEDPPTTMNTEADVNWENEDSKEWAEKSEIGHLKEVETMLWSHLI